MADENAIIENCGTSRNTTELTSARLREEPPRPDASSTPRREEGSAAECCGTLSVRRRATSSASVLMKDMTFTVHATTTPCRRMRHRPLARSRHRMARMGDGTAFVKPAIGLPPSNVEMAIPVPQFSFPGCSHTGQCSRRWAESQNIHSSCMARAKAACIASFWLGVADPATASVAAMMASTAAANSSPA